MHNKYTIEIYEVKDKLSSEIKATVYVGNESLGSIWNPSQYVKNKDQFEQLLTSVGQIIYGQERKAAKQEKSIDKVLEAIEAQNSAR